MRSGQSLIAGMGFVTLVVNAWGAAPEVTSLFPAGAQVGSSVPVTIQGKLGGGTCRAWCSRPGVSVTFPEKPGPITVRVTPQAEPGVCWLRFINDDGASGVRPFVLGTCAEIQEQEPNDDLSKAQPLSVPVVVNGQHGKNGDADSFAVPLRKGQTLVASMLANRVLGSPQDAVLQILGPDGFVLDQNEDDQGLDPQLVFAAPADAIYTLRTWAFPATPDSSIRLFGSPASVYRLTVTTGPFVDHVEPAAVQAGFPQTVRLHGWNLPTDAVDIAPPVSATGQSFEWPLIGWGHRIPATVMVSAVPCASEQEPNELSQPQQVSWPIHVTGRIAQPRDVDAYLFTARKGQRVRFEVIAREAGSPLDPVLRVYDPAGKVLKEVDDEGRQSADPDFDFASPDDGNYRVTITDRFLHHGDRFAYRLSMIEPQPDFSMSVAAETFALKAGAELEIPVTITRTGDFADSIDVQVLGLPASVSAEVVTSEFKKDTSKSVKLKLKTTGPAGDSAPIRIVGRSASRPIVQRAATVSLKSFQADLPDLWLTITK